jgi:hypothetical protein
MIRVIKFTLLLLVFQFAAAVYGQSTHLQRQAIEHLEMSVDINSVKFPNNGIEFTYTFGPSWDNVFYNPKAILFKKNNQLDLQVLGSAGNGKCYRDLIPKLEFDKNSIILYFNAQLRGCDKLRIVFDKYGMKNDAQVFENNKWSSFAKIKNIKISDHKIISLFHDEILTINQIPPYGNEKTNIVDSVSILNEIIPDKKSKQNEESPKIVTTNQPAITDSQRQDIEQRERQIAAESERLAEERRRLDEQSIQIAKDRDRQKEQNQVNPNNLPILLTGKRIALVIGNAKYQISPLKNPINDANDISIALKQSGFEVIDVRDANLQQMRSSVRNFGDRLLNSDVGLVYYSGHGIESKGRNYFIPVNTDIQRDDEIADQALDVNLILDKMTTAGKGVNILIVDACRNDPFTRSFRTTSRGLAAMDAPKGTIIAYSTSPGKVASDGDPKARNSPYTKHLLAAMQVPNRPIELVFKEVRRNVQNDTKNEQTPWENTSLSGDFYFKMQK